MSQISDGKKETVRNKTGLEVEEWRAAMEENVSAEIGMGTREGKMECQWWGRWRIRC